jgi:hypothetical protein
MLDLLLLNLLYAATHYGAVEHRREVVGIHCRGCHHTKLWTMRKNAVRFRIAPLPPLQAFAPRPPQALEAIARF